MWNYGTWVLKRIIWIVELLFRMVVVEIEDLQAYRFGTGGGVRKKFLLTANSKPELYVFHPIFYYLVLSRVAHISLVFSVSLWMKLCLQGYGPYNYGFSISVNLFFIYSPDVFNDICITPTCFWVNFQVITIHTCWGGTHGITIFVIGNGLGDQSLNSWWNCLHFILC